MGGGMWITRYAPPHLGPLCTPSLPVRGRSQLPISGIAAMLHFPLLLGVGGGRGRGESIWLLWRHQSILGRQEISQPLTWPVQSTWQAHIWQRGQGHQAGITHHSGLRD